DLADAMLAQTARFSAFVDKLNSADYAQLTRELFSELRESAPDAPARLERVAPVVLEMVQVMEDAFVGLQLGENWSHPLNGGWMAVFQRWTGSPTFRALWPFIQPLYSREFSRFMNDRMRLGRFCPGESAPGKLAGLVERKHKADCAGLAFQAWVDRNP